ncbi:hypothetical protein ACJVC5_19800 [Peredibacter sp. HCB2-198]|uniref:hypothetical protein n=1 Tax=Peredibacter sp. HCB2-198 TaxID=3383025 RepID=UPI0038B5A141
MNIQSMIKFLPLMLMAPLLYSCGGPATSNAQLSVSSSFIATAGSMAAGGYIVVGENASAAKKFVLSLSGTTESTIKLERGVWKFTAVGWDGSQPFEGNNLCGSVPSIDLNSDTASVEIKVDAASCSNVALSSEINIRMLSTISCDIFYQYNQSTNSFTALSSSFSPSFCGTSMPNDYRSDFTRFRYQSLNIKDGIQSPGFVSECKDLTVPTSLNLPTKKVPFLVKFYKTADDCTNNRASQNYLFKDGIELGSPNFDHKLNSSATMLLLSSARTKRGTSPFMNEIPRVLCGSAGSLSDCIAEPTLNAHINVPFMNDNREQTILKGLNALTATTCDPNTILPGSKYFSAETCSIKDNQIMIKPVRNELLCQGSPFYHFPVNIKDLYQREGKTYVLIYKNSPVYKYYVMVYSKAGKLIAEYDLGSTPYTQISANTDGSKIVVINNTDAYFITVSGNTPSGQVLSGKGGNQVEMDPVGNYFYVANGTRVYGYTSTGTQISSVEPLATLTVPLISFYNGYLYVISENMEVRKASANAGGIGTFSAAIDVLAWIPDSFVVSGGKAYYQKNTELYYSIFDGTLPSLTMTQSAGALATSIMDGKVYFAKDQGVFVYQHGVNDILVSTTNGCSETITVTHGGVSKNLIIESKQNMPLMPIWSDGLRLFGRRFFNDVDKPFYYFESLNDHDDGVRTGGRLERIQEMLGPEALGGFFSQYNTCADVKAAAPFTREHTFVDESKGEVMNFTLAVDANSANEMMPNYICDDADPNAVCSVPYDLILNFSHSGSDRREKMRIKLKCGSQKGTFESADVEYSPSDIRNELLVWNTNSDTSARYEEYSLEQDTRKRGTVLRLHKTSASGVFARWVEVELSGSQKSGSVAQYEINAGSVFTGRQYVSRPLAEFNAGNSTPLNNVSYSFNDIVSNTDFFGSFFAEGPAITSTSSSDIYGTTSSGGYFSDQNANNSMSKFIPLSINDMNIDDSSHPLVLAPGNVGAVFELTP